MRSQAWLLALLCGCAQPPPVPAEVPVVATPIASGEPAPLPSALDELAGTWKLRFSVSGETSCSQSFASSSHAGTYTLTLQPGGAALVVVQLKNSESFGPSPGRYRAGDRGFSHHTSHVRYELRGTASLDRSGLHLSLRTDPRACTTVAPDGSSGEPIPCPGEALTLACQRGEIEALGAETAAEVAKERLAVLRCPWIGLRYPLAVDALKEAPLAMAPGVTVEARNSGFEDSLTVRKTPAEVHEP
jgi:hypothetical protein